MTRWIDRAIAYISPGWALRRQMDRYKLKAFQDTYHKGASGTRRATATWHGGQASADAEAEYSGERAELVARSADLYRNSAIGHAAIDRQALNVVGDTGLVPQSQIDAAGLGISVDEAKEIGNQAEREWTVFCRSCDLARTLSMRGIQDMVLRRAFIDGDVFVNTPYVKYPGDVYGLKLQVIEGARVCNPGYTVDMATLRAGIEYNSRGVPIAYHVLNHFPGEILAGQGTPGQAVDQWARLRVFGEKTGLRRACHLYLKERDGQSRGLPILAPILEPLKQGDRYKDAELMATVVGSMFTVFVKTDDPEAELESNVPAGYVGEVLPGSGDQEIHLGDGAINYLRPNESIETANPARPNTAYEPFMVAIYKEIGAALSIPLEELLLYYQSSYSAARASVLQAWRLYMARRAWLADMFLNHIWYLMWEEAVSAGRIKAKKWADPARRIYYTAVNWVGPARSAIDPLKAVQASAMMVEKGFSTIAQETAELKGLDGDKVTETLGMENKARLANGLSGLGRGAVSTEETSSAE